MYEIPIEIESDVALACQTVQKVATNLGFEPLAAGELALAVSEIAQNAFRHAGGGQVQVSSRNKNRVIKIQVSDKGNGIENIELAMREGYSTIRTSLGIGLEAAQRLVDKFEISSIDGKGTTIKMEKYLPFTTDILEYGVVSVPDEQYNFNGDEYFIKEFNGDSLLLGVIDGCGQGYDAYAMATLIKTFIQKNYEKSLLELLLSCDSLLKDSELTGGAAISLARIEPHQITYLGVGDTHAYIIEEAQLMSFTNFDGRIGIYQLPKLSVQKHSLDTVPLSLVLCTDGISTQVVDNIIVNDEMTAQQLALHIFNDFHKAHGDITVLTTKIKASL